MARLPALPAGHTMCQWCARGLRLAADGTPPERCPHCGMRPGPTGPGTGPAGPGTGPTRSGTGSGPVRTRSTQRNRRGAARIKPLRTQPVGQPVCGIDPGARYTGVVVRDGDAVLHASTLVRDLDQDATRWALTVVTAVAAILDDFPPVPVAVEGVSDPKGFKGGRNASIDPGHIMRAAVVLGAVVATWPTAVVVPPGGNGSQHLSHYPDVLVGRRPADLPGSATGAKTRAHEQSAYDVAGRAAATAYPRVVVPLPGARSLSVTESGDRVGPVSDCR